METANAAIETTTLLRWIILLPLFGAILNGIFLRLSNTVFAGRIALLASMAAFVLSVMAVSRWGFSGLDGKLVYDQWFLWFQSGRINIPFWLEYTPVSGIMLLVVTGIGSLIHLYSLSYMAEEKGGYRFFTYLNLFLVAMLTLVLGSNLVVVFLGWEGVGLCSYLLIGYWYSKSENAQAGMKAFITNRVGDLGFLITIFLFIAYAGTVQIQELNGMGGEFFTALPNWVLPVALLGLFWAATGKSAQFPLYVWLPDAMAGPTPVSALIHAATMVTSGIFVIVRLWPMFSTQVEVLNCIFWGGILTAWLAALIALTQNDIKKVLAYSTVSQLGFMFAALGAGAPSAALFHVLTHAFFKALLFLGSGSVIHGMHHEQDMRKMGGLAKHMKVTHLTFLIGTLAIIGAPLTSGFFSKELILHHAMGRGLLPYFLLLSAALLTAFYMLRAYAMTFWGEARSDHAKHAHESNVLMLIPLVVLAFGSVFVGWLETPKFLGGISFMRRAVEASWGGVTFVESFPEPHHSIPVEILITFGVVGIVAIVAWFSYKTYLNFKTKGFVSPIEKAVGAAPAAPFIKSSLNKFYVDEVYEFLFIRPLRYLAGSFFRILDKSGINGLLHSLRSALDFSGGVLSWGHIGNMQTYSWYMAAAAAALLILVGRALL